VTNRWIRFLLAVLAIAAASAAAYRVVEDEQRLAQDTAAVRSAVFSADTALAAAGDLAATLHAYVAPGQGTDFWAARAGFLLDKLRSALLELDAAASAAGASVAEALDSCDRLAAAELRAQNYVRSEQPLLAGEVIFTESRDLLDAMRIQIARSRDRISAAAIARHNDIRREQMSLLGGAAGVLALVMLLLVPGGRATAADTPSEPLRDDAVPVAAPSAAQVSTPPVSIDAAVLARICGDLAAVSESVQIIPLLDRVRMLIEARGVIVWMSTPDRGELHAAAVSGYDARVVARLGSISRESDNLTADAFRANAVRSNAAVGSTAAALAVPLPSPGGPAGVFSAELTAGSVVDEGKLNAARVIAAQLGAVLGSAASVTPPAEADAAPSAAAVQSSP
jgi:hypothetical protein